MLITAHTLVAGAIASKIPDPIIAPTLSLVSHFVMDSIPHWDFGTKWSQRPKWQTGMVAILDTIIGLSLSYIIFSPSTPPLPLLLSLFFGILPDLVEAPYYMFFVGNIAKRWKHNSFMTAIGNALHSIHIYENIFHTKTSFSLGVVTQALAVVFFLFILR